MNYVFVRNGVKSLSDSYLNNYYTEGVSYEGVYNHVHNMTHLFDNDGNVETFTENQIQEYFYKVPVQTEINGSKVTFLGGGRFLQVYRDKKTGYEMFHEPAWNDFGVGILAYRHRPDGQNHADGTTYEYLMVMEHRPCHGKGHRLYSVKGGMEQNMTPLQCAIKELKEETGYIVDEGSVTNLGEVFLTTMSMGKMALFAVDVTHAELGERVTDGSCVESTAFSIWVDRITLIRQGDNLASRMLNLMEFLNYPKTKDEEKIKEIMLETLQSQTLAENW